MTTIDECEIIELGHRKKQSDQPKCRFFIKCLSYKIDKQREMSRPKIKAVKFDFRGDRGDQEGDLAEVEDQEDRELLHVAEK